MFQYVEGKYVAAGTNLAVIDVNGVGFAVSTSMTTLANIRMGEKTKLFTYLSVREDALELFGFSTEEELRAFRLLISISGVGPKVALAILSVTTPSSLALAIATEDLKALTNASGVGKKLAGRIVLELKDKMLKESASLSPGELAVPIPTGDGREGEAIEALMVLGYSRPEALKAIGGAPAGSSVEEIIRYALKNLVIPY
ncbi:MAG: Holliday junction branch migration protein RuvA [Clostridia bacterium]|nr:Holliday junction branch migration protein RuvA [Clostridia bacterium]MBR5742532.1 Holliday junction branch migration protein RuvA [Clostridia bacterium]